MKGENRPTNCPLTSTYTLDMHMHAHRFTKHYTGKNKSGHHFVCVYVCMFMLGSYISGQSFEAAWFSHCKILCGYDFLPRLAAAYKDDHPELPDWLLFKLCLWFLERWAGKMFFWVAIMLVPDWPCLLSYKLLKKNGSIDYKQGSCLYLLFLPFLCIHLISFFPFASHFSPPFIHPFSLLSFLCFYFNFRLVHQFCF